MCVHGCCEKCMGDAVLSILHASLNHFSTVRSYLGPLSVLRQWYFSEKLEARISAVSN